MNFPVSVRPRNSRSWHFVFWVPLLSLLVACGSAGPDEAAESPWKVAIDSQRQTFSDYEWEILKDYEVTDAELREAKQKAETCMHNKGLRFETYWPYGSRGGPSGDMSFEEYDRHKDECVLGTYLRVEGFHLSMRMNPANEDIYELILVCLQKKELVERTVTAADLRNPESPNHPSGSVVDTPEWIRCEQNPLDNPELYDYVDGLVGQ